MHLASQIVVYKSARELAFFLSPFVDFHIHICIHLSLIPFDVISTFLNVFGEEMRQAPKLSTVTVRFN
jgi:hypothetical protein